jgi:hypothetical protein
VLTEPAELLRLITIEQLGTPEQPTEGGDPEWPTT